MLDAGVRDGVLPGSAHHEDGLHPLGTRHGDVHDVPQLAPDTGLWFGSADCAVSTERGRAVASTRGGADEF